MRKRSRVIPSRICGCFHGEGSGRLLDVRVMGGVFVGGDA